VRHRYFASLVPMALTAILLAACAAEADEWHKTYTVSSKPTIQVQTNDGSVHVSTSNGNQIEARVETIGWRIDDSEVRIIERQTGDRIEFEARVPNIHLDFSFKRRALRIELRIPRDADLSVRSGDGSVETSDNIGALDIRTGDGRITVNGAKGDVRISTGDGRITARDLDGRLDASSGDGRIEVEGRLDAVNLKTNDGSIEARLSRGSRIAAPWSLRSGDGRITLRLPDDFQADLDARTGDGGVHVDFPFVETGKRDRSEMRGKLNGGGPLMTVRTGDGSINISKY
jgi:DUF4097 and DUF4098 domain-containing protein YvlB